MNTKLIATDLDGTLLNEVSQISPRNLAAIRRARQLGIQVVIATGRVAEQGRAYSREAGLEDGYLISSNGARLERLDSGEVLFEETLSQRTAIESVKIFREYPTLFYKVYCSAISLCEERIRPWLENTPFGQHLASIYAFAEHFVPDIIAALQKEQLPVIKMIICSEKEAELAEVTRRITALDELETTRSGITNMEFMAKGVTKGRALERLCCRLGIAREETIALGDSYNDQAMLEFAGTGVFMPNGIPQVRAAADYVTLPNSQDGFAHALEELVFTRL